ncbi:MAG: septum formation initiator family protein [Patescibacteria group bacterium]|nr:MAG: septum formation initiator family protein [Patescibacteria group bacterium]
MKAFFRAIFSKQFLFTICLIAALVFTVKQFIRVWQQKSSVDQDIAELRQMVEETEGKNETLKQTIEYMQTDRFAEEEARTKLNYQKPGEEVTVVEVRQSQERPIGTGLFDLPPAPEPTPEPALVQGFKLWGDYFFGVEEEKLEK